jgi:3-phosphoshikimate 1-carboxyvinyltransferase
MSQIYPDKLTIEPLKEPPNATVSVPGSKSITNRALILAAMSGMGECELRGALYSDDTEVMITCLKALGHRVDCDWSAGKLVLHTEEVPVSTTRADLFVGNSGTSMRFLAALVSLGHGRFRLDGVQRMRERPIEDLLNALRQLGVKAHCENGNGCPPVIIEANGLCGGRTVIKGDLSSQFLSGLLMAATRARSEVVLEVEGPLVSAPYVSMTVAMLRQWGQSVEVVADNRFRIPGNQSGGALHYTIEPDASAASYWWAAAAITDGKVRVEGLTMQSIQGDIRFVELLEEMGCTVARGETGITVRGGPLRGIDVDMNDISDTVMTLAAVACFAEGPTTIRNVAHIRHKETDRLAALATELRCVGADVDEFADGLTITPRPLHGAEIETYNDHRMAMSMALIGLKVPGIVIKNPGCVAKTYPDFFTDLERLRLV